MSPIYAYHHIDEDSAARCPAGAEFDFSQVSADLPLSRCPWCGGAVERGVAAAALRTRKFDCELKDLGFTKLVRVDEGIFENKTRRPGENKYVDRRDPQSFPNLKKTVTD